MAADPEKKNAPNTAGSPLVAHLQNPLPSHLVRPVVYGTIAAIFVLILVWKVIDAERAVWAEERRADTLQTVGLLRARLEGVLNSHIYLTRGLVAVVRVHPEISDDEFQTIARELIRDHTGIRSIQLARNAVVSHVYPLAGNQQALGLDLRNLPAQAPAVERAIKSRRTVVAGPVNLVQGGSAFVSRTPIFVEEAGGREKFWGITSLLIDREHLLSETDLDGFQKTIRVAIRGRDAQGSEGEVFYGDPSVFEGTPLLTEIRLPNGSWQLGVKQVVRDEPLYARQFLPSWAIGLAAALTAGSLVGLLAFRPQQILRVNAQLLLARSTAEHAAESRSRFLAAVSHDLRQPLHALGIFVRDLVEKGRSSTELQPLIEKIHLSAESLTELIHSIMDISRLDAGVVKPNVTEFPMRPLLERLVVENAPYAMGKGLRLRVAPSRAVVRSDAILLESILRNLLVNAIKYTSRGGILLGCRIRQGVVRVEVWDTGKGIAPDEQERIFDEFYQAGGTEDDRRNGLGLGLSIVRRMANLLDHRVGLRSVGGCGSVFSLELPRGIAPARAFAQEPPPVGFNLRHLTILVVDDEPFILQAMRGLLEQWGCRVLTAESSAAAEALLDSGEVSPNILLCDYSLGIGETGDLLIRRLHEKFGETMEAVLISGHGTEEVYRAAESCGSRFLTKPVAPAKLQSILRRAAAARQPQH